MVEWIPSNNVILVRINTELQRVIRSDGALAQPKIIFLEMAKPSKIRTSWSRFSSPSVHSLPSSVSLIQLVTYTHIASLFRSPSHFDFTACMLWHSFSVFFFFLSALTFPSSSLYAHIFFFFCWSVLLRFMALLAKLTVHGGPKCKSHWKNQVKDTERSNTAKPHSYSAKPHRNSVSSKRLVLLSVGFQTKLRVQLHILSVPLCKFYIPNPELL